jgi:putative redox protein
MAGQRKINLRAMTVNVEGELDLEGLEGKDPQAKPGFTGIKVLVNINADLSRAEKEKFLH